jgi:hypothetical protein
MAEQQQREQEAASSTTTPMTSLPQFRNREIFDSVRKTALLEQRSEELKEERKEFEKRRKKFEKERHEAEAEYERRERDFHEQEKLLLARYEEMERTSLAISSTLNTFESAWCSCRWSLETVVSSVSQLRDQVSLLARSVPVAFSLAATSAAAASSSVDTATASTDTAENHQTPTPTPTRLVYSNNALRNLISATTSASPLKILANTAAAVISTSAAATSSTSEATSTPVAFSTTQTDIISQAVSEPPENNNNDDSSEEEDHSFHAVSDEDERENNISNADSSDDDKGKGEGDESAPNEKESFVPKTRGSRGRGRGRGSARGSARGGRARASGNESESESESERARARGSGRARTRGGRRPGAGRKPANATTSSIMRVLRGRARGSRGSRGRSRENVISLFPSEALCEDSASGQAPTDVIQALQLKSNFVLANYLFVTKFQFPYFERPPISSEQLPKRPPNRPDDAPKECSLCFETPYYECVKCKKPLCDSHAKPYDLICEPCWKMIGCSSCRKEVEFQRKKPAAKAASSISCSVNEVGIYSCEECHQKFLCYQHKEVSDECVSCLARVATTQSLKRKRT